MNLLATKNGGNYTRYRIHNDQSKMTYDIIAVILTLKVEQKSVVVNS